MPPSSRKGHSRWCSIRMAGASRKQIAELVDHIDQKYGKRVKFSDFLPRRSSGLTKTCWAATRCAASMGRINGVRLLDLNNDGYLDVVIGNPARAF